MLDLLGYLLATFPSTFFLNKGPVIFFLYQALKFIWVRLENSKLSEISYDLHGMLISRLHTSVDMVQV